MGIRIRKTLDVAKDSLIIEKIWAQFILQISPIENASKGKIDSFENCRFPRFVITNKNVNLRIKLQGELILKTFVVFNIDLADSYATPSDRFFTTPRMRMGQRF